MASITVISHLAIERQAERLREFVRERGPTLAEPDSLAICTELRLHTATESTAAVGRIKEALAKHGIRLSHTVTFEALARLCGGPNWMRVRQMMLESDVGQAPVYYCLQPTRYDGVEMKLVIKATLAELATAVSDVMQATWPAEVAPGLCSVGVGHKLISLEFEHTKSPWLNMRIWAFQAPLVESDEVPQLMELPAPEVHTFIKKVERALEYAHPGLLVIGGTRAEQLRPEYVFTPEFSVPATGFRRQCGSALDTYVWLGANVESFEERGGGVFARQTPEGEILMQPRWFSEETGQAGAAAMDAAQLLALVNRIARLRRLTGLSMTDFLAANVHGAGANDASRVVAVNLARIKADIDQRSWSAGALAEKTGLSLNAVLRVLRYGYAHEEAIPAIASVLGIEDPNELLPEEGEGGIGVRVETGESFLRALKDTHVWRRILGDSLQGEEAEEVVGIAESLQEYVELLQFSDSVQKGDVKTNDSRLLEPMDENTLAIDVQELLDQLTSRGVGVVVSKSVRFMRGQGELAHMEGMPLHQGTVFYEKVGNLKRPPATA